MLSCHDTHVLHAYDTHVLHACPQLRFARNPPGTVAAYVHEGSYHPLPLEKQPCPQGWPRYPPEMALFGLHLDHRKIS